MKRWPYAGIAIVLVALLKAISNDGAPRWLSLALLVVIVAITRIAYEVRE